MYAPARAWVLRVEAECHCRKLGLADSDIFPDSSEIYQPFEAERLHTRILCSLRQGSSWFRGFTRVPTSYQHQVSLVNDICLAVCHPRMALDLPQTDLRLKYLLVRLNCRQRLSLHARGQSGRPVGSTNEDAVEKVAFILILVLDPLRGLMNGPLGTEGD